ncbi:membrane-associated protein, putative, partial [Bodo saltans]
MIHNSRHRWIINRRTVVLTALIVLLAILYVVSQRVPDSPSSSSPSSVQESGRNHRDALDSGSSNDLRSPNEQLLPSRHSPPSPRASRVSLDTRDVIATFDYSELCEPSE